MPGLIEGHFHISFWGVRELPDLDLKLPAERTTVYAVKNAELALRCGYTVVASAGALHRIDVTIRDMVKEGDHRRAAHGRLRPRHLRDERACSTGTRRSGSSAWTGSAIFADGVDEVRKAVRQNINEGCDVIKIYVTGEGLLRGRPGSRPRRRCTRSRRSRRRCEEAHTRNRQIAAHVRGNDGVKLCVEAGIDVIEHATYADDEAIEMIAERNATTSSSSPGLGYHWGILQQGPRLRDLAGDDRRLRVPGRVGARLHGDGEAARGRRPDHPGRRLRLHLVPARRVREGHRAVRHRHGLLADGGDRRRRRSTAPS